MSNQHTQIQQAYTRAFQYEATRGSCPQCVLAALHETLNIGSPDLIKAGDALAGGTALSSQGTCGALIGGMLALSSLAGRTYTEFNQDSRKRRVFYYANKLYTRFISEYNTPLCKDIQTKLFGRSYNLSDKKEYAAFEKAGAHVDKCPSVAGNVAKWTAELILNESLISTTKKE